ncbi:MAG: cytochrome c maturation protein CcmE [Phycisphaeraceae bacterium]
MTAMKVKMLIAGAVLVGTLTYLAYSGVAKGWVYYVDVDQYVTDASIQTSRVRLCGRVAEEGLESHPAKLIAHFILLGNEHELAVSYRGVIPDLFKAGADVVIEGAKGDDGVFHADVLLTKCASKYQAEEHGKRLETK